MRREIEDREPERDPVLAAALLEAYADAPVPQERLDALRARIGERAQALLPVPAAAGRTETEPAGPTKWAVPWPRLAPARRRLVWATPALLAATLAGLLFLGRQDRRPVAPIPQVPIQGVGYGTPEQALTSTVSDAEFARTVADGSDPAALLAVAVGDGSAVPQ